MTMTTPFVQPVRQPLPQPKAETASAELRISLHWAMALFVAMGLVTMWLSDFQQDLTLRFRGLLLGNSLCLLALLVYLLKQRWPLMARWTAPLGCALLIVAGYRWLAYPGLLTLAPTPLILALALVDLPFALATAGLSSLLWLSSLPGPVTPADRSLVLAGLWIAMGLLYARSRPVQQVVLWSWQHYQRAQQLLEEARQRKAELEQVLDELLHANRQLDLLNERLAVTRLMAEEAHKAKAAFVAKVSHEFRTPLNMIIGLVDLMVEKPDLYHHSLPATLLEDLRIVQRNCTHLASMVNDVLDLSQTEAGRLTLHREWVDLCQEIEAAVTTVRPLTEKKGLWLRFQADEPIPTVYCDRTRIRQVILNLVSNAARYTERGGVQVEIEEKAPYVVVRVIDTGPGIAPQDTERIFEPFYQGSNSVWRDRSGSGLGLSISKQFVELHEGRIWVESEPGQGSTFVFQLPIFPLAEAIAPPNRWISEEWQWLERSERPAIPRLPYSRRVIVCDQSGELYHMLAQHFDDLELVEALDEQEVLEELEECPAHALFVNAPEPAQLQGLLERLRPLAPDTPVIGTVLPSTMGQVWDAGAVRYLIKPVTRADLQASLDALGRPVAHILIVDDDPDFRKLLARMLKLLVPGLTVSGVGSAGEALSILRTRPPDAIFLDISLPDMDGWAFLAQKSQDPGLREIPVTIVSAQDLTVQPSTVPQWTITLGQGIPVHKFMEGSLELAASLLAPEPAPAPG